MRNANEYIDIVGEKVIADIFKKASRLYNRNVIHLNSTYIGGGVAEILSRLVPLMNDIGLETDWRTIHGTPTFFDVTKKFHNALQSGKVDIDADDRQVYLDVNQEYSRYTHLPYNCVIVHDPQPLPLISNYTKRQPWIWRCHIDLSNPDPELWNFLKVYMLRYDIIIVSSKKFMKPDLPVEQRIIMPAIEPLSLKNKELTDEEIKWHITKAGIPTDKPIITQVSRMDPWKDPEGVVEVYRMIREKVDCRLVFCYNVATDDPEGMKIYDKVYTRCLDFVERGDVIFVMGNNALLVNAIQRFSTVILQKSVKEGFGLTVTEALWKAKPVVAGNVGGIPSQIKDGKNGFLVDPHNYRVCADRVIELLKNPKLAKEMGEKAKENVRQNFLTTRLLSDYLDLVVEVLHN